MTETALKATQKGNIPHLKKGKRKPIQIRLTPAEHAEIAEIARRETRSMSFIALRRYRLGKAAE